MNRKLKAELEAAIKRIDEILVLYFDSRTSAETKELLLKELDEITEERDRLLKEEEN